MIIKNCPAKEDIFDIVDYDNDKPIFKLDTPDWCIHHKKQCGKVDECLIKQIYMTKNIDLLEVQKWMNC